MGFDFEVCFLRFLDFCDVMMKTLALIKKKKRRKKKREENQKEVELFIE